jgi:hypothetical protein
MRTGWSLHRRRQARLPGSWPPAAGPRPADGSGIRAAGGPGTTLTVLTADF